jgi:ribosomal protein S18 acetylase RimI-like enzyme
MQTGPGKLLHLHPKQDEPRRQILRYRFATLQDCELLARFNLQLIQDGADTGPTEIERLLRRMQRWLANGRYRAVLFSDCTGRAQAFALFRESPREIYLRMFMVAPDARHCGIGRHAVQLLQSEIWTPCKRLTVEALSRNENALAFWRAAGYRDCAVVLEIAAAPRVQHHHVANKQQGC